MWAAGTLEVSITPDVRPSVIPKSAVRVLVAEYLLTALDDDVVVDRFVLRQAGLSAPSDIERIWAETQNFQRTLRSSVQTNGSAELRWRQPVRIVEGELLRVRVLANLDTQKSGRTLRFDLYGIGTDADAITLAAPKAVR